MKYNHSRVTGRTAALFTLVLGGCGPAAPAAQAPQPQAVAQAHPTRARAELPPRAYSKPAFQMTQAVTSFGAAKLGDYVYVLGGYHGTAHSYSREGQSERFERMHLQSGAWEALAAPTPAQSVSLTAFGDKLYRVGGMVAQNAKGEPSQLRSLNVFESFDPKTGSWQALPSLPTARSSHEAVLVGSRLFVVGGWKLDGDASSGSWDDVLYSVDLATQPLRWQTHAIPFRLRAFGAAALGDHIVTVGGIGKSSATRQVHVYDVQRDSWSRGPDFPDAGFGVRAATLGGQLVASGESGTLYALSSDGSTWTPLSQLAFPRVFHQFAQLDDTRLLALGGIAGMREVDRIVHVESVSLERPPDPVTRWELAAPGPAKNRQGIFLRGDQLYLFGGNTSLGQHDFEPENFVVKGHQLDLGSLAWKPWQDFPVPRQSMQTVDLEGDVSYAVGGFGLEADKQTASADVYRFDFENEEWARSAKGLPEPRTQFGLTEHQGWLWIFGGMDFDDSRPKAQMFAYPLGVLKSDVNQPESGFSPAGFDIPRPRRAFAAAQLNGKYYLVGGMAAGFAPVAECDVFDFATQSWSQIPAPSKTRIGAELVSVSGKLYLAGGRVLGAEHDAADKSVEVYDPQNGTWRQWIANLPLTDAHQMRLLPFGQRLLAYSAQRSDERLELLLLDPNVD